MPLFNAISTTFSGKTAVNTITEVFSDLNSHLSTSESPLVSDLILSSPSPSFQDQSDVLISTSDNTYQMRITDDEIKAGIIASMTLDQKLKLLQKRQRLIERMR